METCEHKNKAYSQFGTSNNVGSTSYWICKDCGFEGQDFHESIPADEYEATKRKFNK